MLSGYGTTYCDSCVSDSDFKISAISYFQSNSDKSEILVLNEYSQTLRTVHVESEWVDIWGGPRLMYFGFVLSTDAKVDELWQAHKNVLPLLIEARTTSKSIEVEINQNFDPAVGIELNTRAINLALAKIGIRVYKIKAGTKIKVKTPDGKTLTITTNGTKFSDVYILIFIEDKDGNIVRIGPATEVPGQSGVYFIGFPGGHGSGIEFCRCDGAITYIDEDGNRY